MNLLNKKWINVNKKKIEIFSKEKKIEVKTFFVLPKINKKKNKFLKIKFYADVKPYSSVPVLKMLNRQRKVIGEIQCNSTTIINLEDKKFYFLVLFVPDASTFEIKEMSMSYQSTYNILDFFNGSSLLISPGYPSISNKYLCGFVHTRVKSYNNKMLDVVYVTDSNDFTIYDYDGVTVKKIGYPLLRELLLMKKYEKILIHFFNEKSANVLDKIDLIDTQLYFYLHGAETLYRDWSIICCDYFEKEKEVTDDLKKLFDYKDYVIKKYNNFSNVKWFFVTPWTKNRSEELVGVNYKNYEIMPCNINTDLFKYKEKKANDRKKIFVLRKFDNPNSYSIDIVVRIILELSRRPIFNDLEFNIYGDGSMFDVLTMPIKNFKNVNLHKTFLSHEEIKEVHDKNGIALFPTRYDSQAISLCEAASSGLVVVSTQNPGIIQEVDPKYNTLCNQENYTEYADVIERLYNNPKEFLTLSKKMSDDIKRIYGYDQTIKREIEIFKNNESKKIRIINEIKEQPLLSIVIPAYNVEKYICGTLYSLINQKYNNLIEILVINDGSTDSTAKKVEKFIASIKNGDSVIKLINKKNGGHGSVLNYGLENAKGKYFKILDGDDTFDSYQLEKLIEILKNENSDLILNNYVQDLAYENLSIPVKLYEFMIPGLQYHFNDLCYDGYGFAEWGPLLSTSTYKTECLKKRKFKITEKMPYDDMEWNVQTAINIDTVTYYDLNLYNYLLGREGQSVSLETLKKKYPSHRKMVINLINIYNENYDIIPEQKKNYLLNKIIFKMIKTHYDMVIDCFKSPEPFNSFNSELKKYPYFYNNIFSKKVKLCRLTYGLVIFPYQIIKKWRKNG